MPNIFLDLTVLPYRSLSKKGFKYLMIWVTSIFLGIGIFFGKSEPGQSLVFWVWMFLCCITHLKLITKVGKSLKT